MITRGGLKQFRPSLNYSYMERSLFIALFLALIHSQIFSQNNTFEYIYSTHINVVVNDIYEHDDGSIFMSGYTTNPNEMWGKSIGLVLKISKSGQFINELNIAIKDRRFCISHILPNTIGSIYTAGWSCDTLLHQLSGHKNMKMEFREIDESLNILAEKGFYFPPEYRDFSTAIRKGDYNQFLFCGSIQPYDSSGVPFPFLYILDHNFDSINANFYLDDWGAVEYPVQLPDTSIWMIDGLKSSYYIVDKSMNLFEFESARPHIINNPYGIKWDTDTSFYLTGEWSGGNDHDIGLYRQIHPIDSTNSIFKSWGTPSLDIPAPSGLDFRNKDSIFVGGTTPFWFYFGTWPSWYYVLQTDSNLNVRWERFFGGDAYYMMQKIIASKDGGCIIAGTRYDYQNVTEEELDIHVLKLNSEGLLVGTPEESSIEMREALVFPNPGTDYLKMRVAAHYKKSIFELYDINGKIVLSEQIIGKWGEVNTVALKSGTYVYRIYNEEGLFESGKWLKK